MRTGINTTVDKKRIYPRKFRIWLYWPFWLLLLLIALLVVMLVYSNERSENINRQLNNQSSPVK